MSKTRDIGVPRRRHTQRHTSFRGIFCPNRLRTCCPARFSRQCCRWTGQQAAGPARGTCRRCCCSADAVVNSRSEWFAARPLYHQGGGGRRLGRGGSGLLAPSGDMPARTAHGGDLAYRQLVPRCVPAVVAAGRPRAYARRSGIFPRELEEKEWEARVRDQVAVRDMGT